MTDPTDTSYLAAARRGLTNTANMAAPDPPGPLQRDDVAPTTLVSTVSTAHQLDQSPNPYKIWNGDNTTLAPFLSELDIALSAQWRRC